MQRPNQELIYIENKKTRQTKLENTIENIRKQVCFLILMSITIFWSDQIWNNLYIKLKFRILRTLCGREFLTLNVSNRDNNSNHYFGTIVGEDYFKISNQLDENLKIFNNFSIVKYQRKYYKLGRIYN